MFYRYGNEHARKLEQDLNMSPFNNGSIGSGGPTAELISRLSDLGGSGGGGGGNKSDGSGRSSTHMPDPVTRSRDAMQR